MTDQTDLPPDLPRLSSERIAALRAKVKEHFRRRAEERAAHPPEPVVYDETFFRVTAWVDSLSYTDRWDDIDPDSPDPDDNPLVDALRVAEGKPRSGTSPSPASLS